MLPAGTEDTPAAKIEAVQDYLKNDINNADVLFYMYEDPYGTGNFNLYYVTLDLGNYWTEAMIYIVIAPE